MNFDEMVEKIDATGDTFKSIVKTKDGFQANVESRHGSNSYACGFGKTPTEAVRDLFEQRTRYSQKTASLDDLL